MKRFLCKSEDSTGHALAKTCWQNCHDISPINKIVYGFFLLWLQDNCAIFLTNILCTIALGC